MDPEPAPAIEVFADVCCPFTHVGLRRLVDHRRATGRDDVRLRVRAWPLEIVNGAPLASALIAEEVAELRATVAPDLFAGFAVEAFPSTSMPAFALANAAFRRDLAIGEAVSLELRARLFEHGEDISRPSVLSDVARTFELHADETDTAAVDRDYRDGQARGVVGSPHFFTASGSFFCPALEISRDEHHDLHIAFDDAGFRDFLGAAFA